MVDQLPVTADLPEEDRELWKKNHMKVVDGWGHGEESELNPELKKKLLFKAIIEKADEMKLADGTEPSPSELKCS